MTQRYLLDTNVVSELRKPRPHGGVVAWLQSLDESQLYLSAVTLGEIQAGVELTREQDPPKGRGDRDLAGLGGRRLQRPAHGRSSVHVLGALDAQKVRRAV